MKINFVLICAFCLLSLIFCQSVQRRPASLNSKITPTVVEPAGVGPVQTESRSTAQANETVEPYGPLEDCLEHPYLYSRFDNVQAVCTPNYVLYQSKEQTDKTKAIEKANELTKQKIRIGSFNLFHMGDHQAPLKNYDLIAKVMNQWDLVGAQELMPLPGELAQANESLYKWMVSQNGKIDVPYSNWQVERPGYLSLLKALRRLDNSWSLIIQALPAGEGATGEMAGFYFRGSAVHLKTWDYCPQKFAYELTSQKAAPNLACLTQIPADQKSLISRTAFAAYFQAGSFDFVGLTAHVRFRAASLASDRQAQADQLCQDFAGTKSCKPAKDVVGRFYEVRAVASQINQIQSVAHDKDVIYMGDFNLEMNAKTKAYWEAALKPASGFEVLQTSATTLAIGQNKLLSNYDHFILSPNETSECAPLSAQFYNYTSTDHLDTELLQAINEASKPEAVEKLIAERLLELNTLVKVQRKKQVITLTPLGDDEKADYANRFHRAAARMKTNHLGALMELLSDHLPIAIECQTGALGT